MAELTPSIQRLIRSIKETVQTAHDADNRVLLLLPGGSASQAIEPLFRALRPYQHSLTITLSDERYVPIEDNHSNWQAVSRSAHLLPEASFVPVLSGGTRQQDSQVFSAFLEHQHQSGATIIALLGIGEDGHIAGIKPGSPACHSDNAASDYEAADFERITISGAFFSSLDHAFVYTKGAAKAAVLEQFNSLAQPADTFPIEFLRTTKHYEVYLDKEGRTMKIGFVGLGKMGSQIVEKLLGAGHSIVVFDVNSSAVAACAEKGAEAASSREELVAAVGDSDTPIIWLMIPSDYVEQEVAAYKTLLPAGSMLIDGGNSNFHDTLRRADDLRDHQIRYVDAGTSGGIMGLENGFSLMVGGEQAAVQTLSPLFEVLSMPRGRWIHTGTPGSGHYVKMIHNGIEYALMQSYAEGYDLLKYGEMPGLNLAEIAHVWQGGSIIASSLNELIEQLLSENPELESIDGYVADSGEGRWTYETAEAAQVPMPALREALAVRQASQEGHHTFATKLLAGLRNKFGGHAINHEEK